MASATLSLCSSFAAHCKVSQPPPTTSLCQFNSNLSFLYLSSSSSHKLSSSSRPTFPLLPKSSETESAVVEADLQAPEPEAEPDASEPVTLEVAETTATEQVPKREEIFAVVMVCMCSFRHFLVTQIQFSCLFPFVCSWFLLLIGFVGSCELVMNLIVCALCLFRLEGANTLLYLDGISIHSGWKELRSMIRYDFLLLLNDSLLEFLSCVFQFSCNCSFENMALSSFNLVL